MAANCYRQSLSKKIIELPYGLLIGQSTQPMGPRLPVPFSPEIFNDLRKIERKMKALFAAANIARRIEFSGAGCVGCDPGRRAAVTDIPFAKLKKSRLAAGGITRQGYTVQTFLGEPVVVQQRLKQDEVPVISTNCSPPYLMEPGNLVYPLESICRVIVRNNILNYFRGQLVSVGELNRMKRTAG